MADYKNYLAANILTEDKQVTYRLLSRALKVHVNAAKEMLYDFHRQQNAKKPGTVHATYLLSGTKRPEEPIPTNGNIKKDGEDEVMQSSPFMSSSMPQPEAVETGTGETSVLTITLVREEDLDEIRSQYEHVSSIHIYGLGPHPLKDLQLLSDVTRQIKELTASEDPLEANPKYGTIINKNVKRRTGRRPPPVAASVAKPPAAKPTPAASAKSIPLKSEPRSEPTASSAKDFFGKGKPKTKAEAPTETNNNGNGSNPSSKESTPAPNPPALKRESSSLFKAFAKSKPPKEKVKVEEEDSPMKDVTFSDDEDEEETYVPPPPRVKEEEGDEGASSRKSRKEREEALRRMMEDEDEEEEKVSAAATPVAVEEEEEEDVKKEPEPQSTIITEGGRRRGKRRVMKKKTMKDEEGYLVTKEEAVWESFSEDEPAPKPKSKPVVSSSSAKPKKAAGKPGQGNIMSFFGKK